MLEILVVVLFLLALFAARAAVLVVWSMKQGHFDCLRPAIVRIRFPLRVVLGMYDHDGHGREDRLIHYPKILSANSAFRHLSGSLRSERIYSGRPTRRNRARKRGSECMYSNSGALFRAMMGIWSLSRLR